VAQSICVQLIEVSKDWPKENDFFALVGNIDSID
jgi:hypothetical protein